MFDQYTYLVLELAWGVPILAIEWLFGARELLRTWRVVALCFVASTLYLCIADAIAIHIGIWTLSPARTIGVTVAGLPVEEAIFFAVTNLMVIQGFVLFGTGVTARLPAVIHIRQLVARFSTHRR